MTKLLKLQKGFKIDYLKGKQDNTTVKKFIKPELALRNASGKLLTSADSKEDIDLARIASTGRDQGSVFETKGKSIREHIINKVHKFNDKVTGGQIITDPIRAGAALLRPDKYFENVKSGSDIGDALLNIGMDGLSALPLAQGAKVLKKGASNFLNVVPDEVSRVRLEKTISQNELLNMNDGQLYDALENNPQLNKMFYDTWDPRTRLELGVDKMSESKLYSKVAEKLNGSPVEKIRRDMMQKALIDKSNFSPKSIDKFINSSKVIMQNNGMFISKPGTHIEGLFKSSFGDHQLNSLIKRRFSNKPFTRSSNMTISDDFLNGNPDVSFSANLNANNKEIGAFSFFNRATPGTQRHKAAEIAAGRITNNLIKYGPEDYIYEPGSLSGDSFRLFNRAIVKNKDTLEPSNTRYIDFGDFTQFNSYGKNSNLSKNLNEYKHMGSKGDEVLTEVEQIHKNTFDALGIDGSKLFKNLDPGQFIITPVKKVSKGVNNANKNGIQNYINKRAETLDEVRNAPVLRPRETIDLTRRQGASQIIMRDMEGNIINEADTSASPFTREEYTNLLSIRENNIHNLNDGMRNRLEEYWNNGWE